MTPRKVIIDTDPGQDDAIAILLALASPEEIHILGITAVAGNVPLSRTQGLYANWLGNRKHLFLLGVSTLYFVL